MENLKVCVDDIIEFVSASGTNIDLYQLECFLNDKLSSLVNSNNMPSEEEADQMADYYYNAKSYEIGAEIE